MNEIVIHSANRGGIDAQFSALAGEAALVDAALNPAALPEQTAQAEQQQAQAQASAAQELASLLQIAASLMFPVFPSLQHVYTPDACSNMATVIVPVMDKHGWSVDGITAGWGDEIALAIVIVPMGFATARAVKHDIAVAKAKRVQEEPPQPQEPQQPQDPQPA